MIDLSWSHILLVVIVALVVVGPKDLPRLMHTVGRWMGKARQMADQFRKSFDDMTREAELDQLRAEIDSLRSGRPLADVERDLQKSVLPPEYGPKPGNPSAGTGTAAPNPAAQESTSHSDA